MEWISVKDQPPPKKEPFLGIVLVGYNLFENRTKEIHTCIWDDLHDRFVEYCNCSGDERYLEYIGVMYWMPLPPPPKD